MRTRLRPVWSLFLLFGIVVLAGREGTVTAQPKAVPIVVAPQMPTLAVPFPLGVQRGQTIELNLTGTNLTDPTTLWTSFPAKVTIPTDMNNGKEATKVRVKLEIPVDAPVGIHSIRLATKNGISNTRTFCIDEFPQLDEAADNKTKEKAQVVPTPVVVVGKTEAEVSDFFKVNVKPGQRLTFDVLSRRLGSQLDPIIKLYDAKSMREMPGHYSDDEPGLQSDARLTRTFKEGGDYVVEVRDTRHVGGPDYYYRLRIADCPAAMTAFPVALKRGTKGMIHFTGRAVEGAAPVEVTMPTDKAVVNVSPKGVASGWTVPVYASDVDELVEQEPNNEIAKANRLTVSCGVTGRFLDKGDVDCYVFTAKKGVKYTLIAETYEINSPAEVYLTIKDMKGAEQAKSKPENTPARIDFTAPADGDFVIFTEHLNYLHGPTEVYHLTLDAAEPDFTVNLQLDRFDVAPGATTLIPVTSIVRRDYTGPVELSIIGPPNFSGSVTVANAPVPPAGQIAATLPLTCKADTPAGAYQLQVRAKATINGKEIIRTANISDVVKQSMNGLAFPPREMLNSIAVVVTDKPLFTLSVKATSADVIRGVAANLTITAKRAEGFTEEIQLAAMGLPPTITVVAKPIPKGANEVQFPLTAAAGAPVGPIPLTLRGTAKAAGKDFAYYSAPTTLTVILPVEVKTAAPLVMIKPGEKQKLKVTITRKGDYKGPVDVEVKNLPANVTAAKVTIPVDKAEVEVEIAAAANAAVGDKPDVQVVATATGAANQQATAPNVLLKVVK
jgi:hypothetical protein